MNEIKLEKGYYWVKIFSIDGFRIYLSYPDYKVNGKGYPFVSLNGMNKISWGAVEAIAYINYPQEEEEKKEEPVKKGMVKKSKTRFTFKKQPNGYIAGNAFNIQAVKMLSRSPVFQIGDRIITRGHNGKITNFKIANNQIVLMFQNEDSTKSSETVLIQNARLCT